MSRVGKNAVTIPSNVQISVGGDTVSVQGPKGTRICAIDSKLVAVTVDDGSVSVVNKSAAKKSRMMWGTARSLISSAVLSVTDGYKKVIEIRGVGLRAQVAGSNLNLKLGYSHDINFEIPKGIDINVVTKKNSNANIVIEGFNKEQVGQVAGVIKNFKKPEPYKGKGLRYLNEFVLIKEGKKK